MKKILFILLISINVFGQDSIRINRISNNLVDVKQSKLNNLREDLNVTQGVTNDNCANATILVVNASCVAGTTTLASTQSGECTTYSSEASVWYRFNSGNNSLLDLSWITTNIPNCYPVITVYGPYNSGGGCIPSCAGGFILGVINNGDPGYHNQLSVTQNKDYLIQIESRTNGGCGGASDIDQFCIGIYTSPTNNDPTNATLLSTCGVAIAGNLTGYSALYPATPENLDNNNTTSCASCGSYGTGADVNYVVNNDSWFTFCSVFSGTWNINVSNITNCILPATIVSGQQQNGIQLSILSGTTTSLTNIQNASYNGFNNIPAGQTWTSSNFTVSTSQCIYIIVDGFAGDECTYNLTLTNVIGSCDVLPIELGYFKVYNLPFSNKIVWSTFEEINNDYFVLYKSLNGVDFNEFKTIKGSGNSNYLINYDAIDDNPIMGTIYYKLKQVDYNGNAKFLGIITSNRYKSDSPKLIKITNLLGQDVDESTEGIHFYYFNDGNIIKK